MHKALLVCALTGLGMSTAHAAQPPADAELLEFLGSLDTEDEGWQEYLEQVPVKVAGKVPEKAPPPDRKSDTKQVKAK